MKRMLLFLLMLFPVSMVFGQTYWERLPAPNGAVEISCVAEDATNSRIYAGAPSGRGIYASSDNGATWALKSDGLPQNCDVEDITVDNSGNVFAVISAPDYSKVYKSTDFGDNWAELPDSPGGGTNLFIAANGTFFLYSNLLVGGQGVHQSSDNGDTWQQTSEGLPNYVVFFTYYYPINGFVEDNSGNYYVTVSATNGSTSGVYKTSDNGTTWTRMSEGMLSHRQVVGIVNAADGLYAGVKNRVYRSTDGATSWTQTDSIPVATSVRILGLAANSSGEVYASTGSGTYKAGSGGSGWTSINNPYSYALNFKVFSDGSYVSCGIDIWGLDGGIYRSTDDGATWNLQNNGINNGASFALYVTPTGIVINGLRGNIEVSTDNGATFTRVNLPLGELINAILGNGNGTIVICANDGIATSQDNGVTWASTSNLGFECLAMDQNGDFLAGGSNGVYKSTDNGQSWASLGGGGNVTGLFVTANGTILAGSYNAGIRQSTDNGATWTDVYSTNITVIEFGQTSDGAIYTNTLLSLLKSTDDGANWETVSTNIFQQHLSLIAKDNVLLLGTPAGLYKSADGGANWTNHSDGMLWTFLDYMSLSNDGYLYGTGGSGIYKSAQSVLTGIGDFAGELPEGFALSQNYPNPFNPNTTITFNLPQNGRSGLGLVELKIFDLLGKEVKTLISQPIAAGFHSVQWDGNNNAGQPVASGVYLYRLSAGELVATQKMMLLR